MNSSNFQFKISTLLFFILMLSFGASAQEELDADSIREYKTKFIFSFDSRRSFMFGQNAKLGRFKFGMQLKKKHRYGLSYYGLQDPIIINNVNSQNNNASVDFAYTALFYEYEFYEKKKFTFGLAIHLGGGTADFKKQKQMVVFRLI